MKQKIRFQKTHRSADTGTRDFTEQELRRWAVEQSVIWRGQTESNRNTTMEMADQFLKFVKDD